MWIVAIILASGLSFWLGEKVADYLLMFYYLREFRSEQSFMGLYDFSDNDYNYEFFSDKDGKKLKTYADYLRKHQDKRSEAYEVYRNHIVALVKHTLLLLAIFLVLPTIVFQGIWYVYLTVFVLGISAWIYYKRRVKEYDRGFYVMLVMNVVMNNGGED